MRAALALALALALAAVSEFVGIPMVKVFLSMVAPKSPASEHWWAIS
jgi:hypothetical protein